MDGCHYDAAVVTGRCSVAANIPVAENISFSGYNCKQPNPGNTTAQCNAQYSTDGGGNLTDQWSMYYRIYASGLRRKRNRSLAVVRSNWE